jgi:two-component sensor histidine kinase
MFDTALPQNEHIQLPGPTTGRQADSVDSFLREIHHRLKNTLTLLSAWLRAYLSSTTSADLPMARRVASSAHPWNA